MEVLLAVLDRLLGSPDRLDGPGLARGARRGSEAFAVRCLRRLGERGEEPAVAFLIPFLADDRSAVRRSAAAALGHLARPVARDALDAAFDAERTEEGRVALGIARIRCGADPAEVGLAVEAFEHRRLQAYRGAKGPQTSGGAPALSARFWQGLGDSPGEVVPRDQLLARRRAAIDAGATDEGGRSPAQLLATLQHPDDFERVLRRMSTAGRREEHSLLAALGLLGDPRALPHLLSSLFATDVDPGRGFAQRRLCATAVGRLGLREGAASVVRALENEAADYEGRPGAGMGIQYPVRTNLLWALGEIADPATAAVVVPYLGDTHGSALGGFYLPAMDALHKLGPAAVPGLRRVVAEGGEIEAANAVGVLAALGTDVRGWLEDRRGAVADVARRAS